MVGGDGGVGAVGVLGTLELLPPAFPLHAVAARIANSATNVLSVNGDSHLARLYATMTWWRSVRQRCRSIASSGGDELSWQIMAALRRKMRVFATIWLAFQVTWLSALVPQDCCAAHRRPEKSCHESTSAALCPLRASGGPCPMHGGNARESAAQTDHAGHHADGVATEHKHETVAAEHSQHTTPSQDDCRLVGVCDGPMAGLFALLSIHGVLPEAPSAVLNPEICVLTARNPENLVTPFASPDSPPPRV